MLHAQNRLIKEKDFAAVYKRGRFTRGSFVSVKTLKTKNSATRIGFVVSKKVSPKAVVRNKVKRRLREAMRKFISTTKPGFDVIVLVRPNIVSKSFDEISLELGRVLKQARLVEDE